MNRNTLQSRNLTMLMDFYELSMANGYFENGLQDKIAWFDMFYRTVPDNGGFAVMAGVRQLIDYLEICATSSFPAMYGRSRRAHPSSPESRSSRSAAR